MKPEYNKIKSPKGSYIDIDIEELLGREKEQSTTERSTISRWLLGETVLITGGGGSIGGEICAQLLGFNVGKIVIYDVSENNAYNLKENLILQFGECVRTRIALRIGSVQDEVRLTEVFSEFSPTIIFHAAAYKHVPLMEQCPRVAIENNVLGTYYVALCAMKASVRHFVMISTDKAVNPTNVMGATKRLAEQIVLSLNELGKTKFMCVRFGNVLGSNGSVVPLFKDQIMAGGPVTVRHPEVTRYFMTIPEAASLVLETGAIAHGGEIFILDMGKPVKIMDLAKKMIRLAGLIPNHDIKIEIVGLKKGEKLHEELLLDVERLKSTQNPKIFSVIQKPISDSKRLDMIEHLKATLNENGDVLSFLREAVPEYVPAGNDVWELRKEE